MTRRDLPNFITFVRILLTIPFLLALLEGKEGIALLLFLVAGASDGLDGFLAKRYGWTSRLGSILDPLADKALLVSAFVVLTYLGRIPYWLTVLVFSRDILIVAGATAYHFLIGHYRLLPAKSSKINTLFQITLVLAIMGKDWIGEYTQPLVYLTAVTTVFSGVQYIFSWGYKAIKNYKKLG
ncbi:CDP-alcohol phosphatidyltransferase [Gammaproteobacteria bacterium]